jgi:hypothetical protein
MLELDRRARLVKIGQPCGLAALMTPLASRRRMTGKDALASSARA